MYAESVSDALNLDCAAAARHFLQFFSGNVNQWRRATLHDIKRRIPFLKCR